MSNTKAGHVDCVARLIKVKRNCVNNAHPIFSETIYLSFYISSVKIEVKYVLWGREGGGDRTPVR